MEQFYDKMGGESTSYSLHLYDNLIMLAMEPDEAAPILADFADKLNLEMSGKLWAPSKYPVAITDDLALMRIRWCQRYWKCGRGDG